MRSRFRILVPTVLAAVALVATPLAAHAGGGGHPDGDVATLERYAADTWASLVAMTDEATGLPSDNIEGDLSAPSAYTSPTNIGGYLWSTVVARDLGIIDRHEARDRLTTTLSTLASLEKHEPSGMFYNWYSPADGSKLTTWPDSGDVVHPFLSTVDNGWLAAALRVVAKAEPSLKREALALYDAMDFSWFHDLSAREGVSLNRGGFWVDPPGDGCAVPGNYAGSGPDVYYTCHWYDTTVSEARIATYIGIANGQIPATAYYGTYRTMPDQGCDFGWQEQKPVGETREYLGVSVFEGTYEYAGMRLVPSWGGSMFEALMPDLFVPEAEWGPRSWGLNHPATVEAQRWHGMEEAGYGYWGFSPASDPFASYREYGVEHLGISSDGYASDAESTDVDTGYEGCRDATNPDPAFGDGVVTPHAAFLALPYDEDAVLENLAGLENDLGAYGPGGFYDAVAVGSGTIADRYLSLDQSMIMAAIGNALLDDRLKDYFVDKRFERAIRPLVEAQVFGTVLVP
ncbi:glucoamylase family protein [Salinibacterium soli]|uniref:Glucoamylase family protein n=1 Tax=Antiquaquibacter soli TaxID=3064523 RepID=A0ABT9BU04_9MICO|nr:glucoamylase family protein [Protaetiibacter sp. WY-16]MDO7882837.1 glucoamylase family protein [Protaetiibacter sp. WY-16]